MRKWERNPDMARRRPWAASMVDRNGAVLDRNDRPVPGLFAAGSTVGGLDGGPNAGYVGGLIKATIALRAAEAIAAA